MFAEYLLLFFQQTYEKLFGCSFCSNQTPTSKTNDIILRDHIKGTWVPEGNSKHLLQIHSENYTLNLLIKFSINLGRN